MAGQVYVKYPDYTNQLERVKSFKNFLCSKVRASVLADAGYFFLEESRELVCYSCGHCLFEWQAWHQVPYLQHGTDSPNCSLVSTSPIYKWKYGEDLIKLFKSVPYDFNTNFLTRLETFKNWPLDYVDIGKLASNGFFYTKFEDRVQCEFCALQVYRMQEDDNLHDEHKKHSQSCWMVIINNLKHRCNEIKHESPEAHDDKEMRIETFKNWPFHIKPEPFVEYGFEWCNETDTMQCFSCSLQIPSFSNYIKEMESTYGLHFLNVLAEAMHFIHYGAYPKCRYLVDKRYMISLHGKLFTVRESRTLIDNVHSEDDDWFKTLRDPKSRESSFNTWCHLYLTPGEMVHAGLFYLGSLDSVQCPFCFHQFSRFLKGDSPLERHHKESPNCPFLKKPDIGEVTQTSSAGSQDIPATPDENKKEVKVGFRIDPLKMHLSGIFKLKRSSKGQKKSKD